VSPGVRPEPLISYMELQSSAYSFDRDESVEVWLGRPPALQV
jgi:hypothetical protein